MIRKRKKKRNKYNLEYFSISNKPNTIYNMISIKIDPIIDISNLYLVRAIVALVIIIMKKYNIINVKESNPLNRHPNNKMPIVNKL